MARLHQNNFATNLTSGTSAGATTSPLNSIPSIAAPFYIAFDAMNINNHYEVVDITSKTATNVLHAATSYDHTTAEEVRMVVPAVELDAFSAASEKQAWPIGSVFIAVVSTNPATLLGYGTWSTFATGRTLVGIDTGQTEFDVVEETGGAKTHTLTIAEMPSHQHTSDASATSVTGSAAHDSAGGGLNQRASGLTAIPFQGGGGAHNNLQPYIVTYMWKRTA